MSTRKTGFMYDSVFSQYKAADGYLCLTKEDNPWIEENDYYDTPERVQQAYNLLEKSGLLQKLVPVRATPAPIEELLSFHTPEYIEKLRTLSEGEGGDAGPFCRIGKGGLEVIRTAVGGDMASLDAIMKGELDNAFCLQRPPSAHAERNQGFGFCVVNDYNILINYARRKYGLQRIMLVDFDNHYKLGIEQAWYDSDAVLYAETHQTGVMTENSPADRNADFIGEGQGKGYNVVIPLPTGSGDAAYIMSENPDMAYFTPDEGTNVWYDAMVLTKDCTNTDLAHAFMNFVLDPEAALANTEFVGYTSTVRSAFDAMQTTIYEGIDAYVPDVDNENNEIFVYQETEIKKIYAELWTKVKAK